jgi:predicted nuclease of predicted toxin-antitoxin system
MRLRLLADENIAAPLVHALRSAGHDVTYVAELAPGLTDDAVLSLARQESRLLLTEDRDFGELVFRLMKNPPGIILLRLPVPGWQQQYDRLHELFANHAEKLSRVYAVVENRRFRFRPFT